MKQFFLKLEGGGDMLYAKASINYHFCSRQSRTPHPGALLGFC